MATGTNAHPACSGSIQAPASGVVFWRRAVVGHSWNERRIFALTGGAGVATHNRLRDTLTGQRGDQQIQHWRVSAVLGGSVDVPRWSRPAACEQTDRALASFLQSSGRRIVHDVWKGTSRIRAGAKTWEWVSQGKSTETSRQSKIYSPPPGRAPLTAVSHQLRGVATQFRQGRPFQTNG